MTDSWTLLINGWVGVRVGSTHSRVAPLLSYNCLDSCFKGREQHVCINSVTTTVKFHPEIHLRESTHLYSP